MAILLTHNVGEHTALEAAGVGGATTGGAAGGASRLLDWAPPERVPSWPNIQFSAPIDSGSPISIVAVVWCMACVRKFGKGG